MLWFSIAIVVIGFLFVAAILVYSCKRPDLLVRRAMKDIDNEYKDLCDTNER